MIFTSRRSKAVSFKMVFLMIALGLLAVSCSSKRIISSWSAEGEYKAEEVLVVGVAHHESIRKLLEETVVEDLFAEGVTAIASYSIDGVRGKVDYQAILDAVRHTGSKTVLVMRTVGVVEERGSQLALGRTYDIMDTGSFQPLLVPQETYANYSRVQYTIEASLYDASTRQKVWAAESKLTDPVSSKKYVSQVAALFLEDMKRRGIM